MTAATLRSRVAVASSVGRFFCIAEDEHYPVVIGQAGNRPIDARRAASRFRKISRIRPTVHSPLTDIEKGVEAPLVAPLVLGRPMDVAGMLGGVLGGSWAMGMLMHLVNGSLIFPAVYVYAVYRILPGEPWVKGTTWGLVLWAISQTVVMPMMGAGLFSAKAGGPMAVMASLIAHAVYRALLGGVAGAAEPTPASTRIHATR